MQFTFAAFAKLLVIAVMANTAAGVALPEPMALEARQTSCLLNFCTPGIVDACCAGAACTNVGLLGLPLPGICTPATCDVICTTTADCRTDVPNTTFTCQLVSGQTFGACIPQVL